MQIKEDNWRYSALRDAAREMLRTEAILRANPLAWAAFNSPGTPEGDLYEKQANDSHAAKMKFWAETDLEYDNKDPIRAACWEWRFCKVMARRCTWSMLKDGNDDWARATMRRLGEAEENLMRLLGLAEEYKSPSQYLKEKFPNLAEKAI